MQLSWRCQRFWLDARVGMFSALEHLYASSLQLTAPVALPRVTPIISDLYACPLWLTAPLASPRVPLRVKYVNSCVAASLCMLVLARPQIASFVQAARSRSALLSRLTRGALEPQISVCSTKKKILCGESFRTQKNLMSVEGDLGSVVVVVPQRPPTLLEVPNAANVEVVQERFTRFRGPPLEPNREWVAAILGILSNQSIAIPRRMLCGNILNLVNFKVSVWSKKSVVKK